VATGHGGCEVYKGCWLLSVGFEKLVDVFAAVLFYSSSVVKLSEPNLAVPL
jgi:hypothetical protein